MEKVVVHVKNDSEYVDVTIHWQGGFTSQHEVVRPVRSYEQLRDFDKLMDRIATLRHEGHTAAQIADCLNREGFSPPKRCGEFSPELVHQLLMRRGLANEKTYADQLGPHEWWLPKLAEAIPVSAGKLADWARRGWVHSRKTPAQHLWILWADEQELKRLRKLAALSHRGVVEYPSDSPRRRSDPVGDMVDRETFIVMLTERYPVVAADIDECARGLLHLEMGTLARAVQAAISDEDTAAVREHFRFIGEVYRRAAPEVKNAVHVSYLECLSFDGKHGKRIKAREMLSPELQAGLKGLEAYNAELFGGKKSTPPRPPSNPDRGAKRKQ